MSGSKKVAYSLEDGVATITMNDGKLNIMSTDMLNEISDAFDRAEKDEAIVILRSGVEGTFSAGFDLKIFAANDAERSLDMVKTGAELALRILGHPHPTIGVMEGHAFPMGTFLLLACDVRVATEGPHRMGLNEVAIGIAPPSFAIELARSRMHPAWLSRTVTTGELFLPNDAVRAGLLDTVVAATALEDTIKKVVSGVSVAHRPSHGLAKRRLRKPVMAAMRSAIDAELTMEAYQSKGRTPPAIVVPGA